MILWWNGSFHVYSRLDEILRREKIRVTASFLLQVGELREHGRRTAPWFRLWNMKELLPGMGLVGRLLVCFWLLFLVMPDAAWALQAHGPPEGIYIHQIAHIFFLGSLLYLYRDLARSSEQERGWRYLRWFCLLMLCWNGVAFVGHAVTLHLAEEHFSEAGSFLHSRLLGPMNVSKTLFYITRFDHLLAVPALFFLYLGLRTLYSQVEERESSQENRESCT